MASSLERLSLLLLAMYLFPGLIKGFVLPSAKQMTGDLGSTHSAAGRPGASDESQRAVANPLLAVAFWDFRGAGR